MHPYPTRSNPSQPLSHGNFQYSQHPPHLAPYPQSIENGTMPYTTHDTVHHQVNNINSGVLAATVIDFSEEAGMMQDGGTGAAGAPGENQLQEHNTPSDANVTPLETAAPATELSTTTSNTNPIASNDDSTNDVQIVTTHQGTAPQTRYNTRRSSAANGASAAAYDVDAHQPPAKRSHLSGFQTLPPGIVISILSYIEQTISIDYQHSLHATTLPKEKLHDPAKRHWMIFDLRKRYPAERRGRVQPWIATRHDILMYTMYGKFRSDETATPRLLWTSLQFAVPYPAHILREQFNNATPGFSGADYVPWGQVESLRLSGGFTPYTLKYLQYTQKLEYLSIEAESPEMPYFQVTNRCISLIPKTLQYLDLSYVNIDEAGVRMIFERLTQLKVVGLNGMPRGIHKVSTARLINQAPQLTQLEMRQNEIDDDVALELFKNCRLTFLNLSQNRITPHGWAGLRHNSSIHTLHFFDSQISDEVLEAIMTHPHLRDLHMEGCTGASDTGIRRLLCDVNSKISSISLSRCAISSLALTGITLNDTLKNLYLDFNPNLSVEVFRELAQVRQLKDLSVVGCQLMDAHVETLLHENYSLKNLFLSMNNQLGWGTINALIANHSVSYVILAECESLTDEMVNKLVARNMSIHQLVLDSNKQLTDKAMESIKSNVTLSHLSAFATSFSDEVYNTITNECTNIMVYSSNLGEFFRPG